MSIVFIAFIVVLIVWALSLTPPARPYAAYSGWLPFLAVALLAILLRVLHG